MGRLLKWLGMLVLAMGAGTGVRAAPGERPWRDGEVLEYACHWGMFLAAVTEMRTRAEGAGWEFRIELQSRGFLTALHPIRSQGISRVRDRPWHSLGYETDRYEGGVRKQIRTVLDPAARTGLFENFTGNRTVAFTWEQEQLEDVFSVIYAVRGHDWKNHPEGNWVVCERDELKRAEGKMVGEENVRDLDGLVQRCWVLELKEVAPKEEDRKKKKRVLAVKAWLTQEERRLPLRAEVTFPFGTVRMKLMEVGNENDKKDGKRGAQAGSGGGKAE